MMKHPKAQIAWQGSILILIENISRLLILYDPITVHFKSKTN